MDGIRPVSFTPAARPQAAGSGLSENGPAESVQLGPGAGVEALMDPRLSPEARAEVQSFLEGFTGEELARLRQEGVQISYEKLSPLLAGLYTRDTSFFFPLRKPLVRINPDSPGRKGTGIHEIAHALDRAELKGMVGNAARLLGLTATHASEIKPQFVELFQDYQARGSAQLAASLAASLEGPGRGYCKTEFPGVHYYYVYQPARDGQPATMDLRLHTNPYQKSRVLGEDEGTMIVGGGVGMAVGAAIAAAVCFPVGLAIGVAAALPVGLGVLRHALKKKRVSQWNNFQRELDLPGGQKVKVSRQGETTRVELPAGLKETPDWTWSNYALHTQEPVEYFAEGVRARQESPADLKAKDPALLEYLMPKPPPG